MRRSISQSQPMPQTIPSHFIPPPTAPRTNMQRGRAGGWERRRRRCVAALGQFEIVTEISATAAVSMTIVVVVAARSGAVKTFNKI